jgi:hypothetical protein
MSSSFEQDFGASAARDLLAAFGEDVDYTPKGGVARSIVMIVERNPSESVSGRMLKPKLRLTALNHPTLGINASSFNAGGDFVELAVRNGGTAERIVLHAVPLEQDDGMLVFEI